MTTYKYHYRRYNEFDVLKVNLPTLATVLFFGRHVLGLFIIGMALRGGRSGSTDSGDAFSGLFEPIYMLSDIPALLLLIAVLARHPKSGKVVRYIWRAGPYLLLLSAGLYFGLLVDQMGLALSTYGWAVWLSMAFTVAGLVYVFAAPYARDLFRQFPAPESDNGKDAAKG